MNCSEDEPKPLEPDFSWLPLSIGTGESVIFTNSSKGNPKEFTWTFEGGTPATSSEKNPSIQFANPGDYNVTLTITSGDVSKSLSKKVTVICTQNFCKPFGAAFSSNLTFSTIGKSIQFTDQSTGAPTSWEWTFDGGTPATSQVQNPIVSYSQPGFYNVTLKASNENSTDTEIKESYIAVGFANILSTGIIPYSDVDPTNQVMKVYWPADSDADKHPLLVFAGGGAWVPSNLDLMTSMATRLAQAGYVVATIRYYSQPTVTGLQDAQLRFLKGVQDIQASIRYFRKDAAGSNIYKVDPDNVFIGGYSNGAFLSLALAYITTEDLDQSTIDLFNANGGLEGARGNAGFSSASKAIVSIAGAVYDLNTIDTGEMPIICIHSTGDPQVPYIQGPNSLGTMQYGSSKIIDMATSVGITNKLVPINSTDHNAPMNCNTCFDEILKFLNPLIAQ